MRSFSRTVLFAGLLALLLAGCPQNEETPRTCTTATCSGCCDRDTDTCLSPSKQDSKACGAEGFACVECTGETTCVAGACKVIVPDESCGGVGQPCCAGACAEGAVCLAETCRDRNALGDGGLCGGLGEDCCGGEICNGSLRCESATCVRPSDAGTSRVGDPCSADGECATGKCLKTGFSGGYCSKPCTGTGSCPSGAHCGVNPNDGFSQVCLRACAGPGTASDCRSGYVCDRAVARTGSEGVCIPACGGGAVTCAPADKCVSGFCCGAENFVCCGGTTCDSGLACGADGHCRIPTSSRAIGAACAENTECGGLQCFEEEPAGTGCSQGCWLGGYCSQKCGTGQSACPSGSSCSPYVLTEHDTPSGSTLVNSCLDDCAYDGGRGDCRLGYVCDKTLTTNGKPVCMTACAAESDCNVGGVTGVRCDVLGFCCGKRNYPCCGGGTTPACSSGQGTCQSGVCK